MRLLNQSALLLGFAALCAALLFVGVLAGAAVALVMAFLLGVGATLLLRHLDAQRNQAWWGAPVAIGMAAIVATAVAFAGLRFLPAMWYIAPLAIAASGVTVFAETMNRRRCALCNRRLGPQALTFGCPRCSLVVCDQSCWNFEHRRCQMCLENRVPLMTQPPQWWDRVLGPKAQQGRCQVCLSTAEQADLRCCGRCRRAQCRACWDHSNGECTRCGWAIPELPDTLRDIYVSVRDEVTI